MTYRKRGREREKGERDHTWYFFVKELVVSDRITPRNDFIPGL
jgi:hypothetical protein